MLGKIAVVLFFLAAAALGQVRAEPIRDIADLRQLLSGNSLYGTYDGQHFRQQIRADGSLLVVVKGEQEILRASWFITPEGKYCERWPDHDSCFAIGRGEGNKLLVEGEGDVVIESHWQAGAIDLQFE